jgi:hypothetical protein
MPYITKWCHGLQALQQQRDGAFRENADMMQKMYLQEVYGVVLDDSGTESLCCTILQLRIALRTNATNTLQTPCMAYSITVKLAVLTSTRFAE